MNVSATQSSEDIRQAILQAATERFTQFGYNKTTMAEIARDCNMSAGNLYRYFDNKLDIGANLACGCINTKLATLNHIIQQAERPAAERLRDFVLATLEYTYEQWHSNPRMNEMVNAICGSRLDIVEQFKLEEHQLLVQLLQDGIIRGEFSIADINDSAMAIATAIMAFNVPLLMPLCTLEAFREKAECVVKLMLTGLVTQKARVDVDHQ